MHINASDTALDRETLRGVKTLYVIVSAPADSGLDGAQIQRDAVQRLRSAGIRVTDISPSALLLPSLLVSATILRRQDGLWVYEVSVSLNQAVTIVSTNGRYMAPTWSLSTLAVATASAAPRFVGTDIRDLTDKFIHAYLEVDHP